MLCASVYKRQFGSSKDKCISGDKGNRYTILVYDECIFTKGILYIILRMILGVWETVHKSSEDNQSNLESRRQYEDNIKD